LLPFHSSTSYRSPRRKLLFVRAAALEMPRNLRINAVSPPWVKETMVKLGMDPTSGLASAEVAKAYVAAVEGSQGVILDLVNSEMVAAPQRVQISRQDVFSCDAVTARTRSRSDLVTL
jgi:NAD(P)-dependent dehydrogenase (short-subunit alcohol dehydrogenase family)